MKIFISFFLFSILIFAQSPVEKFTAQAKAKLNNDGSGKQLVWIYFADKGNTLEKYFAEPLNVVSEKSLKRRSKYLPKESLIDFTDLPVNQIYVDELVKLGFQLKQKSRWFNSVSGYSDAKIANQISSLQFVKKIDLVAKLHKTYETPEADGTNSPELVPQPEGIHIYNYGNSFAQLNQINVPALHDLNYNAQGFTVGVFDAGFSLLSHEAFGNMNIIAAWDFVNNDSDVGDGSDMGSGSHGTNTLSTIGGFRQSKLIGPAFGADFILAKTENTDSETPVEEDNWIAAIEWADSLGVDLTSTSLGYLTYDYPFVSYTWQNMDGNTAPITIAADLAVKKGIAVFNSAGNEGYNATHNTLGAPADGDSVIAVGAVTSSGTRASFSSVGNTPDGRIKPDIMAMGSGVTVASSYNTTGYTTSSGTSFSCPLAAGASAILLGINPNLTPIELRDMLYNTASNSEGPNREYGFGIINVFAAYQSMPLPVELVSFNATVNKNIVELNWATATEKNNLGFEIQRAIIKDGDILSSNDNWVIIGFVKGIGTTITRQAYSYVDKSNNSGKYHYRLKQIDFDGTFTFSETLEANLNSLMEFKLNQNYPNPFNPETNISFRIADKMPVKLSVFNILGEQVSVLINRIMDAGEHQIKFAVGNNLPAGIYFAELNAGGKTNVIKMNLLK
ncbi:MAG: S8 family peptidase [Ignavibacteriaceae bacterium]|nr:S8 family peptidase [Ignavibacteriaceae bacterium]